MSKQKLNDLMLSILPFEEFRKGDIVRYGNIKTDWIILRVSHIGSALIEAGRWGWRERPLSDLKFISRDWTLNDLLMAIDKLKTFLVSDMGEMWTREIINYEPKMQCIGDYDLTKSVLNQSNETQQKLIEILT